MAIAYRAIQNGFDARFVTAAELIDELSAGDDLHDQQIALGWGRVLDDEDLAHAKESQYQRQRGW